eukprot:1147901-Pelagomonas_calceolata.AAC.3
MDAPPRVMLRATLRQLRLQQTIVVDRALDPRATCFGAGLLAGKSVGCACLGLANAVEICRNVLWWTVLLNHAPPVSAPACLQRTTWGAHDTQAILWWTVPSIHTPPCLGASLLAKHTMGCTCCDWQGNTLAQGVCDHHGFEKTTGSPGVGPMPRHEAHCRGAHCRNCQPLKLDKSISLLACFCTSFQLALPRVGMRGLAGKGLDITIIRDGAPDHQPGCPLSPQTSDRHMPCHEVRLI